MPDPSPARPRVVVVGGGFGGLYCVQALRKAPVDVTLIDRRNFHLFQPLLYQVATGALSPANIAAPLRALVKYQSNTRVLLGEVTDIDTAAKEVVLTDDERVKYDYLVLAAGSTHHYFGKDAQWEPIAPGLKTIEDATEIRRKVLSAFERAERETDPAERARSLTFVVVGGGPTGVEMAGAIAELAHVTLRRDFRSINPATARVVLVEGQTRVLPAFHEKLSAYAGKALTKMRIETRLDAHVTTVEADHIVLTTDKSNSTERIDTETVVWAAGVKPSPLGKLLADKLGVPADRGRVTVSPDCSVPGHPNYFIVGDMATFKGPDGKPLPGLAPVAMQQGKYVAGVIDRLVRGQSPPAAFQYWDKGSMATIGFLKAVAESNGMRFTGLLAWLAWLFIHILYLAQFSNRFMVFFQWMWNFVTRNRSARLITGGESENVTKPRAEAMKLPAPAGS
jgi:NADH dehydrogenase